MITDYPKAMHKMNIVHSMDLWNKRNGSLKARKAPAWNFKVDDLHQEIVGHLCYAPCSARLWEDMCIYLHVAGTMVPCTQKMELSTFKVKLGSLNTIGYHINDFGPEAVSLS